MAAEIDKLAEDAKRAKGMGISYGRLKAMEFAKRMEERARAVKAAVQQKK